jgi:excisionase family DNA binding protein
VAEKEFFSFDEALHELRLKEEELKRLVSEGEIRAFRDGETMKLRRTDVETLRSELSGGEVVDLGDPTEELVFEDDTDLDMGMATEEISEADTLLDDDVEDVGDVEIDIEVEPDDDVYVAEPRRRRAAAPAGRASADEEEAEPMGLRAVMILTSLLMLVTIPVCIAAASGNVTGIARSIAGIFGDVP